MQRRQTAGFSLIELIVSLGVFSVIVTISVGALLILIASNRQLQDEQSVLTNLSFALDSMTREMRTGSFYYCDSASSAASAGSIFNSSFNIDNLDNVSATPPVFASQDCHDGRFSLSHAAQGVAFVEAGDSITGTVNRRILYYFDRDNKKIYRKIGNEDPQSIVSDGIFIVEAEFFVTGSASLFGVSASDNHQAAVTVQVEAAASDPAVDPTVKTHQMQTTVVQRILDL